MNSKPIITNSLWNEIKDVIPTKNTKTGRPEWCPRKTLEGIFFVLHTGCQWLALPSCYGNPKTVHGKFMRWCKAGIFSRNPTDRAKRGVKISMITDWSGAPLTFILGASNRHDSKLFIPTLETLKFPSQEKAKIIAADSAYDSKKLGAESKNKNYVLLAVTNKRRNKDKANYQPAGRWIIERTFGWIAWHRGLKTCWCKTKEALMGLVSFAASIQLFKMGGFFR